MGFLKKLTKKAGRVVTSKSRHTKKIIKVAAPIAAVGAGFMIGAPTLGALFASRFMGGNSEQSAAELPGETIDEYNARQGGFFAPYGGFGGWAQQGLFKLGRSAVKRTQEAGGAPAVGAAAGAGAAATTCANPALVTQAVETVCRLCGGG